MWAGVHCPALLNFDQMSNILKTSVLYYLFMTHLTTLAVAQTRGAQIPGEYFFLRRGQIFLGPQYGIAVMLPVWRPEY
jgi:hypothetical protein